MRVIYCIFENSRTLSFILFTNQVPESDSGGHSVSCVSKCSDVLFGRES